MQTFIETYQCLKALLLSTVAESQIKFSKYKSSSKRLSTYPVTGIFLLSEQCADCYAIFGESFFQAKLSQSLMRHNTIYFFFY